MARVTLKEFPNALTKIISDYNQEVITELNKATEEYSKKMADNMQQATTAANVVDTGKMRDGWTYEMNSKKLLSKGLIYNASRGSVVHFHEFGTSKMSASPYIEETFERTSLEFRSFLIKKITNL